MEIPSAIADLTARPVAVFGSGISGRAVSDLLNFLGIEWVCYDEFANNGSRREFTEHEAREHRLVVYSPGFPGKHPWLEIGRDSGCVCMNEIDFASLFWPGEIIAVTGTNGKTTLTEFIAYAYREIGIDAQAVGNNKYPLSRLVESSSADGTIAVCEVSSFQAEDMRHFNADALIWTNFSEDHLDRHGSMEDYFAAKWNLIHRLRRPFLLVADETVVHAADEFGRHLPEFASVVGKTDTKPWKMPETSAFAFYPQMDNLRLVREFWRRKGLPGDVLQRAAECFSPRPHRFVKVGEIDGVDFWNNSKSTDFTSALAATDSLGKPILWIGGGKSKGGDVEAFALKMAGRVKAAFLIGETASYMVSVFESYGKTAQVCSDMREAVNAAYSAATPGDSVVLSPGFASFDMYANFEQRGDCFADVVLSLMKHLIRC